MRTDSTVPPPSSERSCYLCGTAVQLTRDHIPPANLFHHPRPTNLITVDCCEPCNNRMKLSDERMRVFLSAPDGRSPAGDQVWKEGVVQSSFKRSERLRSRFALSMKEVLALRNGVISQHAAITIPQDEADVYMVRITKSLLRHFYPDLDYRSHVFSVEHIEPFADNIGMLFARFIHNFSGDGVFRFFRGVVSESCMGIWVYAFYERAWFLVTHGTVVEIVSRVCQPAKCGRILAPMNVRDVYWTRLLNKVEVLVLFKPEAFLVMKAEHQDPFDKTFLKRHHLTN